MRETDLYQPVREYLESNGYDVQAEVKNCDIAATRGNELVIVELKAGANMRLLVQATDRQQISDSVYVAVPAPARTDNHWRGIQRVLRRLELGLLVVNFGPLGPRVEKLFDPLPYDRKKQSRKRRAVIAELAERSGDYNQGGSTGQKLVTAYRENAILIACCLARLGPSSPARLRSLGTGKRTLGILANNHYGWFQRVERGVYRITDQGLKDLEDYPELRQRSRALIDASLSTTDGDTA
ncbi:MAG: hypothetical protein HUJ31_11455 [Pseudomonadales bacterium]|nr:hypothetical protein [Pseudomonadales bacterium]